MEDGLKRGLSEAMAPGAPARTERGGEGAAPVVVGHGPGILVQADRSESSTPPIRVPSVSQEAARAPGSEQDLRKRIAELEAELAQKDVRPMDMAKSVPEASIVLVENTSERMHAISEGQPQGAKGVRVKRPYVNLWPGLNKVPVADWVKALKEPMVKLHLQERTFVERARINAYEDLAEADAVALLRAAWEPNLLKDWAGKDARPNVQDAIKRQYDQITGERANPDKPAQRTTMKAFAARMSGVG